MGTTEGITIKTDEAAGTVELAVTGWDTNGNGEANVERYLTIDQAEALAEHLLDAARALRTRRVEDANAKYTEALLSVLSGCQCGQHEEAL